MKLLSADRGDETGVSLRLLIYIMYLLASVWQDLRARQVTFLGLTAGALGGLLCLIERLGAPGFSVLLSLLPGLMLWGLAKISREQLGTGDALFILTAGLYLEAGELYMVLLWAIWLAALWALVLWLWRHLRGENCRGCRFAFLPFLLPGSLWLLCSA